MLNFMRIVGVLAQAWAGEFSQPLLTKDRNGSQVSEFIGTQVADMSY